MPASGGVCAGSRRSRLGDRSAVTADTGTLAAQQDVPIEQHPPSQSCELLGGSLNSVSWKSRGGLADMRAPASRSA